MEIENRFALFVTLFSIYASIFLPGALLFFLRRRHHPISLRGYDLVLFQTFVPFLDLLIKIFDADICYLRSIRVFLIVPLWITPYFFRAWLFWYRYARQSLITKRTYAALRLASLTSPSSPSASPFTPPSSPPPSSSPPSSPPSSSSPFSRSSWFTARTKRIKERAVDFFQHHPFFMKSSFAFLVLFIIFSFYVTSAILLVNFKSPDPDTCIHQYIFYFCIVPIIGSMITLSIFIYLLWGVSDPYLIKYELIGMVTIGVVFTPLWGLSFVLNWIGFDTLFLGLAEIFSVLVTLIFPLVGSYSFTRWLRMSQRQNSQTGALQNNTLLEREFWATLEHPILSRAFERFTRQCWCSENLLFFKVVEQFKEKQQRDLEESARNICNFFIVDGAQSQVNIESSLQKSILASLESKQLSSAMFDKAEEHCLNLLKHSVFPAWKQSSSFKDCLRKLKLKSIEEFIGVKDSLDLENLDVLVH